MKIFVTGCAGFIGYHLCFKLLQQGHSIIGIDNFSTYYNPNLKGARSCKLETEFPDTYKLYIKDISDFSEIEKIFNKEHPDKVVNLAAQAGVRHSVKDPFSYVNTNLVGFFNILHLSMKEKCSLIYASSSSVYGRNISPWKEDMRVNCPSSFYGATKICNEVLAESYVENFKMNITGLRFFTVYGPWGRPDMAMFLWAEAINEGKPITLYNNGDMNRSFTFIDDIVEPIVTLINKTNTQPGHKIYNLGNCSSINIEEVADLIGKCIGKKVIKEYHPEIIMGDVKTTHANIELAKKDLGFFPKVSIYEGIPIFVEWFLKYVENINKNKGEII